MLNDVVRHFPATYAGPRTSTTQAAHAPEPDVSVHPDRYVLIRLYSAISGFTAKAVRRKIESGVWIEGREWIRAPDGHIFIDREGVQRWLQRGA